ncbi:SDR family NAD(P)-dependent oxidoreductase [Kineosporia sp. J2-2]|uniref:SDR family NAD(P)-dependent oxidoreductase n=1 Tax=Kineosporia corallincola TaxID=2835133 RepID=A0ABS5TKG4_9ACTN|nr:SDR family NAD(P)-dependent oxidoreductase [Kineosporia corallincola]MBT0771592.1 SDR family NAD(P)-dependent oxidoreductase [Kineosporia corallincola]
MDITNSTVFMVGGTSGLGLGIAQRLAGAGSTVIVGGRRADLLKSIADENPGIGTAEIDVTDGDSVARARDAVLEQYPGLSAVVTMSGIMHAEDLRDATHFDIARATVETNLLGTIRVVDAFTPHLLARGAGTIVTVSSGIAFVPFPLTPAYGATKAGIHSYTESLRAQLAGTGVEVAELVPPLVATTLMGSQDNPSAMPVRDFVEESVELMARQPTPREITVGRVLRQRNAVVTGDYDEILQQFTGALATLGHQG